MTAKDGVEAISVLQDHRPEVILLDVEMPRMDGYEFARHVRNNPDTADLPIIMVTSRVSAKHRARAIEIGVNETRQAVPGARAAGSGESPAGTRLKRRNR